MFDWIHFSSTIISRCFIIGVKYGYYSPEHMFIFKNFKLSLKLKTWTQLGIVIRQSKASDLLDLIETSMADLQVEDHYFNFKVYQNQDKFKTKKWSESSVFLQSVEETVQFYNRQDENALAKPSEKEEVPPK